MHVESASLVSASMCFSSLFSSRFLANLSCTFHPYTSSSQTLFLHVSLPPNLPISQVAERHARLALRTPEVRAALEGIARGRPSKRGRPGSQAPPPRAVRPRAVPTSGWRLPGGATGWAGRGAVEEGEGLPEGPSEVLALAGAMGVPDDVLRSVAERVGAALRARRSDEIRSSGSESMSGSGSPSG